MRQSHFGSAALVLSSIHLVALGVSRPARADVAIAVDGTKPRQTMEGFGATTISLAYGAKDNVPAGLRAQAIQAAYGEVRLNMGNLEIEPFEASPANVFAPGNDDSNPSTLNASGFNWAQSDNMFNLVVKPARPLGFIEFWLGPVVSSTFAINWANGIRSTNYSQYLDEVAEHVSAGAQHWRDAYGITPKFMQLFNEPLSGNGELVGGSQSELIDIVKRTGARLRADGFATLKFVVPAEETEQISLDRATAILNDVQARAYVGAIAYHPYPYGSTYAAVPNILSSSGAGTPDAQKVAVRNQLRDLGRQYGVPVFMVEVSHAEVPFDSFDHVRGRAIQIHDELVHADAAAFFGMNALWDSTSHAEHYAGRADPGFYSESDTIVLIDNDAGKVIISPMGRAIGHYARFIRPGAVRLEATSADALVQVTAFRDDGAGRAVAVLINNANAPRTTDVTFGGVTFAPSATISGEQSTAASVWQSVPPFATAGNNRFVVTLPANSVTSLSAPLPGGPAVDGGMPGGAGGGGGVGVGGAAADGGVGGGNGVGGGGGGISDPASNDGSSSSDGCSATGRDAGRASGVFALFAIAAAAFGRARRRR